MKKIYIAHKEKVNKVAVKAVRVEALLVPAYTAASFFIIASILLRNLS